MVVNLLRDAKRCCINNSDNVLDDYVLQLSDDVSSFEKLTSKTVDHGRNPFANVVKF